MENSEIYILEKDFRKLLELSVCDNIFVFNGEVYIQTNGVAMGGRLGPLLANMFLDHLEENFFKESPYFPSLYVRYVDDTFCLFENESHIQLFYSYIKSVHPNINFSIELESNNSIDFLDITIHRADHSTNICMRKKLTDKGLYFNFESFIPINYKINLIKCLVFRIYTFCSNWTIITNELSNLKYKLKCNGFPEKIIQASIASMLDKLYINDNSATTESISTVKRKRVVFALPYLGIFSKIIRRKMKGLISKHYPGVEISLVFKRGRAISSMFPFKDVVPLKCKSGVVYQISCTHEKCEPRGVYIGKTINTIYERFYSSNGHLNEKTRDSALLRNLHCNPTHNFDFSKINVLSQSTSDIPLQVMESIHLKYDYQNLNDTLNTARSSIPLYLF